jgi:hypothetical protein
VGAVGVVVHSPDLSFVGVLPLLLPSSPLLTSSSSSSCLLGLLVATTSGRSGLAIQLALVSPVVLLGRLVLLVGA